MNWADLAAFSLPVGWLLAPLLVAVILYDLRFLRIPNLLVLLFAVVALVSVPLSVPLDEVLWRLLAAVLVLLAGFALFALRLMGAGDVKLMAVLMLLVPVSGWAIFALLFSLSIFLGTALLMGLRRATATRQTRWLSLQDHSRFPLGLSIGIAGLAFLALAPHLALTA